MAGTACSRGTDVCSARPRIYGGADNQRHTCARSALTFSKPCQAASSAEDFGQTADEPCPWLLLPGLNSLPSPDAPVCSFTHLLCYVLSNMGSGLPFSLVQEHTVFLIKVSRYCCKINNKDLHFFPLLLGLSLKNLQ